VAYKIFTLLSFLLQLIVTGYCASHAVYGAHSLFVCDPWMRRFSY
jgi:hypothetical protein